MFCPKCGNKLDQDDVFCMKCGSKVDSVNENSSNNAIINSSQNKEQNTIMLNGKHQNKNILLLIVIGLLIFIFVMMLFVFIIKPKENRGNNSNTNNSSNNNNNNSGNNGNNNSNDNENNNNQTEKFKTMTVGNYTIEIPESWDAYLNANNDKEYLFSNPDLSIQGAFTQGTTKYENYLLEPERFERLKNGLVSQGYNYEAHKELEINNTKILVIETRNVANRIGLVVTTKLNETETVGTIVNIRSITIYNELKDDIYKILASIKKK